MIRQDLDVNLENHVNPVKLYSEIKCEEVERGFSVGECRSVFCAAQSSSFSRGRRRWLC